MLTADEEGLIEVIGFDHAGGATEFRNGGFEATIFGGELGRFGSRAGWQ